MMKQKLFTLLTCLALLAALPLGVLANGLPMIVDNAGIFSSQEVEELEQTALTLREQYAMDVVILTVNSLDGKSAQAYADDYYDYNGYGFGDDDSGMLLLLAMEERDWYISTYGDAIYALTDYGIRASMEEALPYFAIDDYYRGFHTWLAGLPEYLDAHAQGRPIDGSGDDFDDYYHGDQEELMFHVTIREPSFLLSLIIGVVVAAIAIFIMRSAMNTKRPQHSASDYLVGGSFHLRTHQDLFLYSNISKRPRPKENSSGGGSSVHRSSSGRRHGGGGGKF